MPKEEVKDFDSEPRFQLEEAAKDPDIDEELEVEEDDEIEDEELVGSSDAGEDGDEDLADGEDEDGDGGEEEESKDEGDDAEDAASEPEKPAGKKKPKEAGKETQSSPDILEAEVEVPGVGKKTVRDLVSLHKSYASATEKWRQAKEMRDGIIEVVQQLSPERAMNGLVDYYVGRGMTEEAAVETLAKNAISWIEEYAKAAETGPDQLRLWFEARRSRKAQEELESMRRREREQAESAAVAARFHRAQPMFERAVQAAGLDPFHTQQMQIALEKYIREGRELTEELAKMAATKYRADQDQARQTIAAAIPDSLKELKPGMVVRLTEDEIRALRAGKKALKTRQTEAGPEPGGKETPAKQTSTAPRPRVRSEPRRRQRAVDPDEEPMFK